MKKEITKKEQDLIDKKAINKHKNSISLDEGDLQDLFQSELGNERDIAKELFASTDVETKTEVTDFEIRGLSVLSFYANYIQFDELHDLISRFLRLKISRKRKSRDEFVKALGRLENNNNFNPFAQFGK